MNDAPERLPRHDWFILPLLSLLSLFLVLGVSEVAARLLWPEQLQDSCAVPDPMLGLRYRPECRSQVKSAETEWLDNAYNACGFRTAEQCGPRPDNGFRVAVIGSSISSGYLVAYPETFSAQATALLEQRCHLPVDFQNLALPGTGLEKAPLRLDAALALRPNVVLMAVSAHDLEIFHGDTQATNQPTVAPESSPPSTGSGGIGQFVRRMAVQLRASRAALVAQHFLYKNLDSYLPLYLRHGDEADYLRPPFSAPWVRRLSMFENEITAIASRTQADGVRFMVVFVPLRAQALLLGWKHLPPDVDPTALGKALGEIARRHDVLYLDLTQTIGGRSDAPSLFYPVDSHPNGAASTIIAEAVANGLVATSDFLAACREQTQARQ